MSELQAHNFMLSKLVNLTRAVWKAVWALPKKSRWGPVISASCVLFRACCKLAPWAALFQNLTKPN